MSCILYNYHVTHDIIMVPPGPGGKQVIVRLVHVVLATWAEVPGGNWYCSAGLVPPSQWTQANTS